MSSNFPYPLLHEVESINETKEPTRYKQALHKLHVALGVIPQEDTVSDYTQTIIDLNEYGYSRYEICQKYYKEKVNKVFKEYNLKDKPIFLYKVGDTYIQNIATIKHWDVGWNTHFDVVQPLLESRGISMVKNKYHWHDLPVGAKYILKDNIDKILVKKG